MLANPIIEQIFSTKTVVNSHGVGIPLDYHIDLSEGAYLAELIESDSTVQKTLEVGCAYGISSLFICSALAGRKNPKHIILDPHQNGYWQSIGTLNLKRAGYDFFELIEEFSEFSLPTLAKNEAGTFDLIFIDGWHTFDHTLLDIFYANKLLRVGGYVVIDDCQYPAIEKAVDYFSNYPAYQLLPQPKHQRTNLTRKRQVVEYLGRFIPRFFWTSVAPIVVYKKVYKRIYPAKYSTMVALKKIAEDERRWDWFLEF